LAFVLKWRQSVAGSIAVREERYVANIEVSDSRGESWPLRVSRISATDTGWLVSCDLSCENSDPEQAPASSLAAIAGWLCLPRWSNIASD
jgi:hypothetical protein